MRAIRIGLATAAVLIALLVAPWALLAIIAGALAGAASWFEISNSAWVARWSRRFKAVALAAAVGAFTFAWLVSGTPWKPQATSAVTPANRFIRGIVQDATPQNATPTTTQELDRLNLREAMQDERRKLALISQAPALYETARKTNLRLTSSGEPDERLASALREFLTQFEKEREPADEAARAEPNKAKTVRLLAPEALQAHVKSAVAAVDRLEKEGLSGRRSSQDLRNFRLSIPDRLNSFQIDPLFGTVAALQEQLRGTLKLQLRVDPSYTVRYERNGDSLVAEQAVRLRLADHTATGVDLTGLFSVPDGKLGSNLSELVSVKVDGREPERIDAAQPHYKLPPGVRDMVVTKQVRRAHAAEPLFKDWLPVQFTQVHVDWPIAPEHSITINLKLGQTGEELPLVVPLKYAPDARLGSILMPRYATHFTSPAADVKIGVEHDELELGDKASRLSALATGASTMIRVELLPAFLSNPLGQTFKSYLAAESLFAALAFFVISTWGVAALKPREK